MRNSNLIIMTTVAVCAILSIGAAMAADLPLQPYTKAPALVVPLTSWTGFYGGVNLGGGWGDPNVKYSPNDDASASFFTSFFPNAGDSFKTSGVSGGLQLGYNYQFDRKWLVGFETDFDGTGIRGSGSTLSSDGGGAFSSVGQRVDWFGTARTRLGFLPTYNLLAYFTGGLAYGNVERSAAFTLAPGSGLAILDSGIGFACKAPPGTSTINGVPITTPTCFAGASRGISTGWTLGGGLEYAFWQRWTLRAEYLYVNLGSKSVTEIGSPYPAATPSSLNANFRSNFNVARIGVNYRFGGPFVAKY